MHGRLRFDEKWYLETYPDIRRALNNGTIKSPVAHYLKFGTLEGRLPHAPDTSVRRVFSYGSYGSNNVGDEAILEGVRKLYPNCLQFYMNRMRNGHGFFPSEAVRNKGFFRSGDHLVIGGGGLLYNRPTVELMANLAESVTRNGGTVDIGRMGCEAANPSYYDEIRRLFSFAEKITVRSTNSQRIMETITGELYPVEYDFAFNLRGEVPETSEKYPEVTIGLVTASLDQKSLDQISELVSYITKYRSGKKVNIIHFPQSRSYFNEGNNDVIMGERIWIAASMQNARDPSTFRTVPYIEEPVETLRQYKKLDGLISSRYHGLVFAHMCNIPTLAVGKSQPKVGGFVTDHPSHRMIGTDYHDIRENFETFMSVVMAHSTRS